MKILAFLAALALSMSTTVFADQTPAVKVKEDVCDILVCEETSLNNVEVGAKQDAPYLVVDGKVIKLSVPDNRICKITADGIVHKPNAASDKNYWVEGIWYNPATGQESDTAFVSRGTDGSFSLKATTTENIELQVTFNLLEAKETDGGSVNMVPGDLLDTQARTVTCGDSNDELVILKPYAKALQED